MRTWFKSTFLGCVILSSLAASGESQNLSEDHQAKVDALVVAAYESASEKFPCKVKDRGKPRMLRWQDVDRCLNEAYNRVDWEALSEQLQNLGREGGYSENDLASAVESSLSAHAMTYDKVLKPKKIESLLPLTNSVLKYLPEDALLDYPVFDKAGERIGTFSGPYGFDKKGGLTGANTYRMIIFQYKDPYGQVRSSSAGGKVLLLDSFGIPWKGAMSQPGFRLLSDKLLSRQ